MTLEFAHLIGIVVFLIMLYALLPVTSQNKKFNQNKKFKKFNQNKNFKFEYKSISNQKSF